MVRRINLAGRQRMLSQKMFKEFLRYDAAQRTGNANEAFISQVRMTMQVFDKTLTAIRDGGEAPQQLVLNEQMTYAVCPPAQNEILSQLQTVTKTWNDFSSALES